MPQTHAVWQTRLLAFSKGIIIMLSLHNVLTKKVYLVDAILINYRLHQINTYVKSNMGVN